MAVDERSRHELYLSFGQTARRDRAGTLMSWSPVGWADVATEHDLDELEQTRTMLFAMVASVCTAVSLTYAAVRLG